MNDTLTREQQIDILNYIGVTKIIDRGKKNIQLNCPIHGESTPSMGLKVDDQIVHCFSCHFSGSIEWLVFKALPDEFKSLKEVEEWIKVRYNVDLRAFEKYVGRTIKRYEELESNNEEEEPRRHELARSFLAPFKSGKETYKYFFDRGFTKAIMREYMIGRDLAKETVTIPIFHQDGVLAGVIGRYIDPNRPKNYRYEVYDFPKGTLLYPIHKFEPYIYKGLKVAILVEGNLDSLWLHQHNYRCALATQGNGLTHVQAKLLKSLDVDIFILAYDNDKGGEIAVNITKKILGDAFMYRHLQYPEDCKDIQDMNKEQIDTAIQLALRGRKKIKRLYE